MSYKIMYNFCTLYQVDTFDQRLGCLFSVLFSDITGSQFKAGT